MSFYVKQLGRHLNSRETGSNKQQASKSCALSLVRQLYHLNVIEVFSGIMKKKDPADSIKPYSVVLDPELEESLTAAIETIGVEPACLPHDLPTDGSGVSLLCHTELATFQASEGAQSASTVSWCPPQQNWNPWLNCNIDEGPLANVTLDDLSVSYQKDHKERIQSNTALQEHLQKRAQLPVFNNQWQILEAMYDNPVTIIRGNTGCGKTTQVCQFILDDCIQSGSGAFCNIIVTQPRRISAVSVADRVAVERGEELGQTVGYSVRFESSLPRPFGGILFCTVGVLLRKLEGGLRGVSHVIVDEIHERDINTDFVLIVLRDMVRAFPDLRIVLMSATIDISMFNEYFENPVVIEVEGRTFPVKEYFLEDFIEESNFIPTPDSHKKNKRKTSDKDEDLPTDGEPMENLNLHIDERYSPATRQSMTNLSERDIDFELVENILLHIKSFNMPGAVLIFLPGWNIIFTLMRHLTQCASMSEYK